MSRVRSSVIPHAKSGLPMFYDATARIWRVCGRIKTDRPKLKVRPFADYLAFTGQPSRSAADIQDYDRYQINIPILDQQQVGSCVGHAHTAALMKARDIAGEEFVALSADSLYAQIDNDVDEGSDPADAITALESTGICTLADVPDNFVLWSDISASAKATAARFRIVPAGVYSINSFADLVTADYLGFATTLTVNVGDNFNPDDSGVVGFAPGVANHDVSGGEAKRTVGGQPQYRFRNSWNTTWGFNGLAWLTAEHIDNQPDVELYAIRYALVDPNDPTNPPS